jgi:hypothetical protein
VKVDLDAPIPPGEDGVISDVAPDAPVVPEGTHP